MTKNPPGVRSPVAKYIRKFNKPKVHPDKTKYQRKPKHKQEQDND